MIRDECTACGENDWEPFMKVSLAEDAEMWECQGCWAIVARREYEGDE